ncbi:NADP-dependent aryl-alcohol dehydrogenase [Rhizocola hellebori]|uniref:NADP-dependent aryl-alcohol dehydrogenase n=1 Tax=Rhizocola hellebori TaxID=1392758 RepID=A0A8J3QJ87_9ACTN|nr:aldo/keto reductase [Rhizocola hellebori]GIH10745.1 NADP-dependent aryl-alcohol dehydrogenase [Rhizocola hellebori]
MKRIADFDVYPLCLGGNVFGWTADEEQSFAVLDAYAEAGGNFIDTADVYSAWAGKGGESETIIGRWMAARGNRDQMIIATKVGMLSGLQTLTPDTIRKAAEDSLRRLGTDRIDLYYAHIDDQSTPLHQTLEGFTALVKAGKVRHLGASNFTAARLTEALDLADREGFARYAALQPHYNLVDRAKYEGELAETVAAQGLSCVPFFGLARGFLTGKYRPESTDNASPRSAKAREYLDERGLTVLEALDAVAAQHQSTPGAVALAWLAAQPTVAAPIASARNVVQLNEILSMATLALTDADLARLAAASA